MKLYTYFRSSAAYRVRIALNVKQLDYELLPVHLRRGEHRSPEYLRLNPQGLLPALEHEGAVFSQSLAIIEYLDEIVPDPPLLPDDAVGRAVVRSMALQIACEMHPLCNLRVLNHLRSDLGQDERGVEAWYHHWVAEGFRGLEQSVLRHGGDGPYCVGGQVSLADICLVPQMYNATRFGCDLTPYPTLGAINEHLERLPAFFEARPEGQPDAE